MLTSPPFIFHLVFHNFSIMPQCRFGFIRLTFMKLGGIRLESQKGIIWKNCCITIFLIIINITAYIIYTFLGEVVYNIGSLSARPVIENKEYYRLISCMFLHGGIDHIIGNMVFLAALGEMLEREIGHVRFCILYMLSGIGGSFFSLVYMVLTIQSYSSVGASGAITGLIGALLLLVLVNNGRYASISLKRILLAVFYMIYTGLQSPVTDNAAHIGGLVCGFFIMAAMYYRSLCR